MLFKIAQFWSLLIDGSIKSYYVNSQVKKFNIAFIRMKIIEWWNSWIDLSLLM